MRGTRMPVVVVSRDRRLLCQHVWQRAAVRSVPNGVDDHPEGKGEQEQQAVESCPHGRAAVVPPAVAAAARRRLRGPGVAGPAAGKAGWQASGVAAQTQWYSWHSEHLSNACAAANVRQCDIWRGDR
jgi:hypothetical protein